MDLGFTSLEAEVYVALLAAPTATGYRVAQTIGKPTANTYKAIESLQAKGAVLVDDGERRVCRAVPVKELLRRLERDFRARRERAAAALEDVGRDTHDDRVYRIRSIEQLIERCRTMLASAHVVVLVDAYPEPLARVREELLAAATRGVAVYVKTYGTVDLPGVEVAVPADTARILAGWPGHLNVVVDAAQVLLGMLDRSGALLQGVWTRSTYVACTVHSGLGFEIRYSRAEGVVAAKDTDLAASAFGKDDPLFLSNVPGYHVLMDRFGRPESASTTRKESP